MKSIKANFQTLFVIVLFLLMGFLLWAAANYFKDWPLPQNDQTEKVQISEPVAKLMLLLIAQDFGVEVAKQTSIEEIMYNPQKTVRLLLIILNKKEIKLHHYIPELFNPGDLI